MAHIRLDDKRIELSTGTLLIGTGGEAQGRLDAGPERGTNVLRALLRAAVADGACPTDGGRNAVVSKKAPAATLEVVDEGASKGLVYHIRAPLAHIGHGEHNDVIGDDDSVSDSHTWIQRRASGWFVVDMDSTNGTYVSGERVRSERALKADAAVRFGGVKVIFRSRHSSGSRPPSSSPRPFFS